MAHDPASGAATRCVGVLGLEIRGKTVAQTAFELPDALAGDGDGGWRGRIEAAREAGGLNTSVLNGWVRSANGIVWDLVPLGSGDFGGATALQTAVESAMEDILTTPGVPPFLAAAT